MLHNNERRRAHRGLFWPFLLVMQASLVLIQENGVLRVYAPHYPFLELIQQVAPLIGDVFPRVILLEGDASATARVIRKEESDVVPQDSSNDEQAEEEEDDQCTLKSWQTESHPNCNDMHALSMKDLLYSATPKHNRVQNGLFEIFPNGGNRIAGKVAIDKEVMIYKTGRYHLEYIQETFDYNRVESVTMEMLKGSSPNVYGFCGMLSTTENGDGGSLEKVAQENRLEPTTMLKYAVDISRAVANMHSIDKDYVTLIHRDLDASNTVFIKGKPKIIDFHASLFVPWNASGSQPCRPKIVASLKRPDTLPPEMMRDDTQDEKIDVYGLGGVMFYILTNGARLYHCERPKGICNYSGSSNTISDLELRELKFNGTLPHLPIAIQKSSNPATKAIRDAMEKAIQMDRDKRPRAKEIADELERIQHSLVDKKYYNSSHSEDTEIFGLGAPLMYADDVLDVRDMARAPALGVYLQQQSDGKLCLNEGYPQSARILWCSPNRGRKGLYYTKLQRNGKLVIREGSKVDPGQLIWESKSSGTNDGRYYLTLDAVDSLAVFRGSPESPGSKIWSTVIESLSNTAANSRIELT